MALFSEGLESEMAGKRGRGKGRGEKERRRRFYTDIGFGNRLASDIFITTASRGGVKTFPFRVQRRSSANTPCNRAKTG